MASPLAEWKSPRISGAGPQFNPQFDHGGWVPTDGVGRALLILSHYLALLGGALLAALVVVVVLSVAGRSLFSTPIYGDFELVAMGTAIAVCTFLPYCQLRRGNVIVDLFLARAPEGVQLFLDGVGSVLLAVLSGGLAWRSALGMLDMITYEEVTMIVAIPVWWAFPAVILSLGLLSVVSLYLSWRDFRRCWA